MDERDLRGRLSRLAAEKFDVEPEVIDLDLSKDDADWWDSLGSLMLFMAIEAEFGTRFSTQEILEIRTLAEICSRIIAKRGAQAT